MELSEEGLLGCTPRPGDARRLPRAPYRAGPGARAGRHRDRDRHRNHRHGIVHGRVRGRRPTRRNDPDGRPARRGGRRGGLRARRQGDRRCATSPAASPRSVTSRPSRARSTSCPAVPRFGSSAGQSTRRSSRRSSGRSSSARDGDGRGVRARGDDRAGRARRARADRREDPRRRSTSAAAELGLTTMELASGAGHDAQPLAAITPSGMVFVPSVGGVSHDPAEETAWEDCVNGANVLLNAAVRLAEDARRRELARQLARHDELGELGAAWPKLPPVVDRDQQLRERTRRELRGTGWREHRHEIVEAWIVADQQHAFDTRRTPRSRSSEIVGQRGRARPRTPPWGLPAPARRDRASRGRERRSSTARGRAVHRARPPTFARACRPCGRAAPAGGRDRRARARPSSTSGAGGAKRASPAQPPAANQRGLAGCLG